MKFEHNLAMGHYAEVKVRGWLESQGFWTVPSYDFTGSDGNKSPRACRLGEGLVLPDIDAFRKVVLPDGTEDVERFWVEVKHYRGPAYNRTYGIQVHGIKRRHYQNYLEIQRQTGSPVWLFVMESEGGAVLCQSLDNLGIPLPCQCLPCEVWNNYRECRAPVKDSVYFDRANFLEEPAFVDPEACRWEEWALEEAL